MPWGAFPDCCCQRPRPCGEPLPPHTSTGGPPTLPVDLVQSPVGSLLLSPGSWCVQNFVCPFQDWSLFPEVLWKSYNQIPLAFKVRFPGDPQSLCRIPRLEAWHGVQNFHKRQRASLVLFFSSLWFAHPAGMEFDFIMIVPLLPSHCSFFFVFGHRLSFFGGFLSMAVQQLVVILVFSQKGMSARHSTLPSWIRSSPKTVILNESISDEYSLSLLAKKKIKETHKVILQVSTFNSQVNFIMFF